MQAMNESPVDPYINVAEYYEGVRMRMVESGIAVEHPSDSSRLRLLEFREWGTSGLSTTDKSTQTKHSMMHLTKKGMRTRRKALVVNCSITTTQRTTSATLARLERMTWPYRSCTSIKLSLI